MKLYKVVIERDLYVMADSDIQAEQIGLRYENEESVNDPSFISVDEATNIELVSKEWRNSIPYGGDDKRTVRQILEAE